MAQSEKNHVNQMSPYWDLKEEEEEEAFCKAECLLTEGVKYGVLRAVRELKVFEIIKRCGPGASLSAAEIVAELQTSNTEAAVAVLGRMLDLLATHNVLTVTLGTLSNGAVQRRYGLAPVCKFLTPNEEGVCLSNNPNLSIHKAIIESSFFLKDVVVGGEEPFKKAHGINFYEFCGKQSNHIEEFHDGMSSQSILVMRKILKKYKGFQGISNLVDVGGSNGATLHTILSQFPTIKGINFDQPSVVATAPSYPGVEHVGGDFFVSVPKGDAIFLKWILHNYSDEACIRLLKNCYAALPEDHGKVIICEGFRPCEEEMTNSAAAKQILQLDIIMMATIGGKERTEKEFEALAKAAGFQGFQVVCSVYVYTKIMELSKKI